MQNIDQTLLFSDSIIRPSIHICIHVSNRLNTYGYPVTQRDYCKVKLILWVQVILIFIFWCFYLQVIDFSLMRIINWILAHFFMSDGGWLKLSTVQNLQRQAGRLWRVPWPWIMCKLFITLFQYSPPPVVDHQTF